MLHFYLNPTFAQPNIIPVVQLSIDEDWIMGDATASIRYFKIGDDTENKSEKSLSVSICAVSGMGEELFVSDGTDSGTNKELTPATTAYTVQVNSNWSWEKSGKFILLLITKE